MGAIIERRNEINQWVAKSQNIEKLERLTSRPKI